MQQPPGWSPPNQHGQYQQFQQQPPPKKKTSPWVWVAVVFGALFACGGIKNCGKSTTEVTSANSSPPDRAAAAPPTSRRAQTKDEVASQLPWVAEVHSNCERYKSAPNEIKKSAIFNDNSSLVAKSSVKNMKGKLSRLSTNQGGDELTLEIDVGDVEFSTEGLLSPIKKGSAVYNAAAEMTKGQCVIFSASGFKASSMVEQSQVCDTEYFATFTALSSCP